jgi:hypothetical protein
MKRAAACACVLLIGAVTSCGADLNDAGGSGTPHGTPPPGGVAINGTVREWRVTLDRNTVHAGPVKFTTANLGTITHEFVVIRTDILDGRIPLAGNKFDEEAPGVSSPGEISEFEVGKVGETVINLEPGHYQLVCNLPGHYHNGMHVPLLVVA